jgi:hypothetical protein
MKKFLLLLGVISFSMNIILCSYIFKNDVMNKRIKNQKVYSSTTTNDYSNFYFMSNPIDQYFMEKLGKSNLPEIEIRDYQTAYLKVWRKEYKIIMGIIRNKCIYKEDISNYNKFTHETESSFDKMKPLLLNEMLDNYKIKESPEKNSFGNGTAAKLDMYKGMTYRNACMLFIPYLESDYKFPSVKELDKIIKD